MTTKHTPGPWAIETVLTSCGICHKVGPFPGKRLEDKPRYACLYADYPSKENPADAELEANARLIAAAPELLEALRVMIAWANAEPGTYPGGYPGTQAAKAIAKATGGNDE